MTWLGAHPILNLPIEWPPYSADVSPIETLWAHIQQDVNAANPITMDAMKRCITRSWNARTRDGAYMERLLGGWSRIQQLAASNGETLPY